MNKDPKHCQQPSCSPTDLYSLLLIFTSIHLCLNSGKLAGKSLSLPRIKNKFGSTWGGGGKRGHALCRVISEANKQHSCPSPLSALLHIYIVFLLLHLSEVLQYITYRYQCFGSGSGFRGLLDPDPYSESGSGYRGLKKVKNVA